VRNMVDHRRLCHATAMSELDPFHTVGKVLEMKKGVAAWHGKFQDLGGTGYFGMTHIVSQYSNSTSRPSLAMYTSHLSMKLQLLTCAQCEATETRGRLHTPDGILCNTCAQRYRKSGKYTPLTPQERKRRWVRGDIQRDGCQSCGFEEGKMAKINKLGIAVCYRGHNTYKKYGILTPRPKSHPSRCEKPKCRKERSWLQWSPQMQIWYCWFCYTGGELQDNRCVPHDQCLPRPRIFEFAASTGESL